MILINNAGSILRKPAAEHPEEYWDAILETNLSAQFLLARELGKNMIERGSGKIIFTASLLSFQGGNASDFMGPVVFLASDAAAYVHGEILVVDGGWMGR